MTQPDRKAKIDAKTMAKKGCSFERYLELRRIGGMTRAYTIHRNNALLRGVPWEFTLASWWDVWQKSGKWEERGCGFDGYVMCRRGDVGPYSTENVYIARSIHNTSVRPSKISGLPRGVTHRGNRFIARRMIRGEKITIGRFDTAEEAGAAYVASVAASLSIPVPSFIMSEVLTEHLRDDRDDDQYSRAEQGSSSDTIHEVLS